MSNHLVVYVWILVFSGLVTSGLTVVCWRNRHRIAVRWFAIHLALDAVWAFVSAGMLLLEPGQPRLIAQRVATSLGIVVPVAWFGFVLAYTGHTRWLTRRRFGMLSVLPVAVGVAGLVVPSVQLVGDPYQKVTGGITLVRGIPALPVLAALTYDYLLFLLGTALIARLIRRADDLYLGQAVALGVGTLVPVVAGGIQVLGLVPVEGLPVTPAAVSIYGLAFAYATFHHELLSIVPAVRQIGESDAIQDLTEGVVIVNADGTIVQTNRSAREAFGEDELEVGGKVADVFDRIGAPPPSEQPADFEHEGSIYEVRPSSVEGPDGREIGSTFVFRDITERRNREQRLEVLNRVFRHNIRNEMTAAMGHAQLLADGAEPPDRDLSGTVLERCERVVTLSEKAQTIEQMMEGNEATRSVVIADLLESVTRSVRADHGDATITRDGDIETTIQTRESVLRMVLENVVENAVQHANAEEDADDPRVTVRVDANADGCRIEIEDDGPGLPTNELAVIEKGVETALLHGSGLGLWLIKWGAEELGGDVTFRSGPGGTTVSLWVPKTERTDDDGRDDATAQSNA